MAETGEASALYSMIAAMGQRMEFTAAAVFETRDRVTRTEVTLTSIDDHLARLNGSVGKLQEYREDHLRGHDRTEGERVAEEKLMKNQALTWTAIGRASGLIAVGAAIASAIGKLLL